MLFIISTVSGYLIIKAFLFTFHLESWFRIFFDLLTPFGRRLWPEVGFSNSKNLLPSDFRYLPKINCLLYESVLMWSENWSHFPVTIFVRMTDHKMSKNNAQNKKKGRVYRQIYSICDTLVPDERNFGLFSDRK